MSKKDTPYADDVYGPNSLGDVYSPEAVVRAEKLLAKMYSPPDMVNHPPHYKQHPSGVECIQITEHFNFCIGNAIKYLWRSEHKNGLEDLKKAEWYIKREIERRTK